MAIKAVGQTPKVPFWRQVFMTQEARGCSHLQFATISAPLVLGPFALVSLVCSNWLKSPSFQFPKVAFLEPLIESLGKSYSSIFTLLTVNNIAISLLQASPSRTLSYLALLACLPWVNHNDRELIETVKKIRSLKEELRNLPPGESEKRQELLGQIKDLYLQAGKLNSKINLFGRLIYTVLLIPTFVGLLPFISATTRFGKPESPNQPGKYTTEVVGGWTLKHYLEGYNGKPPYLKLFLSNGKKEIGSFFKGIQELVSNVLEPKNSQGTLIGRNAEVEALIDREPRRQSIIGRWGTRLSAGFTPTFLNIANIFSRFAAVGIAGLAVSQLGTDIFNHHSQFDIQPPPSDDSDEDEDISAQNLEAASNFSVSITRWLSGISGLLIGLNPKYATAGPQAITAQIVGSSLYLLSGLTGNLKGLPASLDNSLQFAGAIIQWYGYANGAEHSRSLRPSKLPYGDLEQENARNNIVKFNESRHLTRT